MSPRIKFLVKRIKIPLVVVAVLGCGNETYTARNSSPEQSKQEGQTEFNMNGSREMPARVPLKAKAPIVPKENVPAAPNANIPTAPKTPIPAAPKLPPSDQRPKIPTSRIPPPTSPMPMPPTAKQICGEVNSTYPQISKMNSKIERSYTGDDASIWIRADVSSTVEMPVGSEEEVVDVGENSTRIELWEAYKCDKDQKKWTLTGRHGMRHEIREKGANGETAKWNYRATETTTYEISMAMERKIRLHHIAKGANPSDSDLKTLAASGEGDENFQLQVDGSEEWTITYAQSDKSCDNKVGQIQFEASAKDSRVRVLLNFDGADDPWKKDSTISTSSSETGESTSQTIIKTITSKCMYFQNPGMPESMPLEPFWKGISRESFEAKTERSAAGRYLRSIYLDRSQLSEDGNSATGSGLRRTEKGSVNNGREEPDALVIERFEYRKWDFYPVDEGSFSVSSGQYKDVDGNEIRHFEFCKGSYPTVGDIDIGPDFPAGACDRLWSEDGSWTLNEKDVDAAGVEDFYSPLRLQKFQGLMNTLGVIPDFYLPSFLFIK